MTTATVTPTAVELAEALAELYGFAQDAVEAERQVQEKAREIASWDRLDRPGVRYVDAWDTAVEGALKDAAGDSDSELDADDIATSVKEAIEVLHFAIQRSGDA